MEEPSPSPCFDPKQQPSCELPSEDPPGEGAPATPPRTHPVQDPSVPSPFRIQEPSTNPLEKIRDLPLQLLSPSDHSSLPGSPVGPRPSSLLQNTGKMPETSELSLEVLQKQIELLTVQVTDLRLNNKKLKDQLAAAVKVDVKDGEQEVLQKQVELLTVQVTDLRLNNKKLKDQLAAAVKVDVKDGEQEDLISNLLRCHDYICCEREKVPTQLPSFVADKVFVDLVQAPGSELPQGKLTPLAKLVSVGMIDDIYRLHLEEISLDGKFSPEDFYWTSNKKVKLGRKVLERARPKTDKGVKLDYAALEKSIDDLFEDAITNGELPVEFKALKNLMLSQDLNNKKGLIRYNMSLMDDIAQKNHFLTMYSRFEQLLKEEQNMPIECDILKSDIVLSYIVAGNWTGTLQNNRFVLKAHDQHGRDKGLTRESTSGSIQSRKKLLEKWRHSLTHLHEHSIELGKVMFHDTHHVQMMESCTPGVFGQFQEGMNAIGELEYPHLVAALKA